MTLGKFNRAATPIDKKLVIKDLPYPVAVEGTIIVRNKVSGLNYTNVHQLKGSYPLNESGILGLENAGEVVEIGEGVTQFKVGDRVIEFGQPYHAEHSLLSELNVKVRKIPDNVTYETAAALTVQGLTAITLIEKAYVVKKDDFILVQAVAGGVGSLLAQLIHDKGAAVTGTTSSKKKAEFAKKNGADYVINYKEENVLETVLKITKGEVVYAVYESVGGSGFEDSIKAVRYNGSVIAYGYTAGPSSPVEVSTLFAKNVHIAGISLLNYFATPTETEKWWNRFFELTSQCKLKPTIYKTYTLNTLSEAFDDLASVVTFGKLLLSL